MTKTDRSVAVRVDGTDRTSTAIAPARDVTP
jgi:hypothetical protein